MKTYINWKQYDDYINKIVWYIKRNHPDLGAVYGLPRGGLPIAVSLSHKLNLPLLMNYYDRMAVTRKEILVVDDIADTGHTLKDFDNEHNVICTLHYHKQSIVVPEFFCEEKTDEWIVYPWEEKDSKEVQDYLKEEQV